MGPALIPVAAAVAGSVAGNLTKKTPKTQASGFGALPGFAQSAFEDLVTRGQEVSTQQDPFLTSALTQPQQEALATFGAPSQTVGIGNFGLGQRGSEVLGQAQEAFQGILPEVREQVGRGTADITGQEFGQAVGDFTNPFNQQVLDPALADLREQGRGAFSDIGAAATAAGGFGGTRQAFLEAQEATRIARESGRLSGQFRQRGFESAAQRALGTLEQNRARSLSGAGILGQTGVAVAGGLGQLGANLFQQRGRVQDIRTGIRNQQLQDAERQFAAGGVVQGLETERQQLPISQLQFLGQTLGGLPGTTSSVGAQGPSPTQSALAGAAVQAIPGIASSIGGLFGGGSFSGGAPIPVSKPTPPPRP